MSAIPGLRGSLILLWAGEDPAVHAALLEALNAAGIPCKDMALGDDGTVLAADPLPIEWKPRFGFEVAVLSSDLTAAQQILEKLLAEEPQDLEIPEQAAAPAEEPPKRVRSFDTVSVAALIAGSFADRERRGRRRRES